MCVSMCVHKYVYIYINVYVYVHIYVHMYIQQNLSIDLSQSNLQSFLNGRHQELCCEGKKVMASPNDGDAANKRENIGMQQENKREFTNWRWKPQKKSNNDMDVFQSRRREIREINTRNVTVIHKCRKGLEKMSAVVWGPSRIPS